MSFTGIKDLDLIILSKLSDNDLLNACLSNKYIYNICNSDNFWRDRIVKKYGESYLEYKPIYSNWKNYYMRIIIDQEKIRKTISDHVGYNYKYLNLKIPDIKTIKKIYNEYRNDNTAVNIDEYLERPDIINDIVNDLYIDL